MEDIYCNVYPAKPVSPKPSTNQTGPSRSKMRLHWTVALCLGLLSVFLLVWLIILGVCYRKSVSGSAAELAAIKTNLTEQRDLLVANLTEVTNALKRLQHLAKQKKTCPAGWRMHYCRCYLLSTKSGSWESGRQDCRARGADLVVVDSLEVQKLVTEIMKQETWIGLTDRNNKKTWKWINGAPLTVRFWQQGQPDKGNGNPKWGEEDCAILQPNMKTEENWNDLRCDAPRQWICEKSI